MSHSSSDSVIITSSSSAAANYSEQKHIPISFGGRHSASSANGNAAANGAGGNSNISIPTRRSKRTRPLRSEDEESDEEYKEASSDEERRKRRRSLPGLVAAGTGGLVRSQSHPHNLHRDNTPGGSDISRLLAVAAAAEAPSAIAQQLQYQQMLMNASNQLAHLGFGGNPATGRTDQAQAQAAAAAAQFYGMNPMFPFMPHPQFALGLNPFGSAQGANGAASNGNSSGNGSPPQMPNFFPGQAPWFDPTNAFIMAALQQQRAAEMKPLAASGLSALAAATTSTSQPSFPMRFNLLILDPNGVERPYADVLVNSTAHLAEFAAVATGQQQPPTVEIFQDNQQRFVPVDMLLSILSPTDGMEGLRTLRIRVSPGQRAPDATIKAEPATLAT
eukprot:TRINITY_DN54_c1_g1_i1.p1 TRINITY_DN54_c1_g1~~TRINITY_DN54_c1_g1_i1.p1  ORF type:complete len:389 (-),score=86.47 TRINITY_DN54_c1_g1_i1:171-1337(-)